MTPTKHSHAPRFMSAVLSLALSLAWGGFGACKNVGPLERSTVAETQASAAASRSQSVSGHRQALSGAEAVALQWLIVGGGGTPSLNQVSIEADVALAARTFAGPGRVLFSSGVGAKVQVMPKSAAAHDPVLARLADLMAPRPGRDLTYRRTSLGTSAPKGVASDLAPATPSAVREAIAAIAAATGGPPKLLFFAGHGDQGKVPNDTGFILWGGDLRPRDLAPILERSSRPDIGVGSSATATGVALEPIRMVMTACFSGGFAEAIYAQADVSKGAAAGPVRLCGLFAAPADRESSGCDPNPDRRAHESYGIHFLNALSGRGKTGQPLGLKAVDLDGDGKVSLLEAHSRARIQTIGLDLPITTSERWLRGVAPSSLAPLSAAEPSAEASPNLPEEHAVIAALKRRLVAAGVKETTPASLRVLVDVRRKANEKRRKRFEEARLAVDRAAETLVLEVLARWPVLDDPWHPEFAVTYTQQRRAISEALNESPAARRFAATSMVGRRISMDLDDALIALAPLERLARAYKTVELARRLKAHGGADWDRYVTLLACERFVPPIH